MHAYEVGELKPLLIQASRESLAALLGRQVIGGGGKVARSVLSASKLRREAEEEEKFT